MFVSVLLVHCDNIKIRYRFNTHLYSHRQVVFWLIASHFHKGSNFLKLYLKNRYVIIEFVGQML